MAVFNFNGRQRKHEIELANMQYAARMRELDKSLAASATEGSEERKFRGSELAANRNLSREEGRENRKFAREEGQASRKHATKSQRLNFKLGMRSYRANKEADLQVAERSAGLERLRRLRALSQMGETDPEAAEARLLYGPALTQARKAQFESAKLDVQDPAELGAAESEAQLWTSRAAASTGRLQDEQNAAEIPMAANMVKARLDADLARLQMLPDFYKQNMGALVPGGYAADARAAAAAKAKSTVRPERRPTIQLPPDFFKE